MERSKGPSQDARPRKVAQDGYAVYGEQLYKDQHNPKKDKTYLLVLAARPVNWSTKDLCVPEIHQEETDGEGGGAEGSRTMPLRMRSSVGLPGREARADVI